MNTYFRIVSGCILFSFYFPLFSQGEQMGPPQNNPNQPVIVFSPNIYNQIAASAGVKDQSVRNVSSTSSIQDIAFIQKVSDKSSALLGYLMAFLQDREKQQTLLEHFKATCCEYKWRLIFGSLATSYAYITYRLKSLEHTLIHTDAWSQWRKGSMSELYSTPDAELARDLLFAIQRKYTTLSSIEDFNTPLIMFMKEIQKEEKMLGDYLKLVKRLEMFRVSSYFSINHSLVESISCRKDKLAYLQSRLWNWLSEHKLNAHLK